jgi:hypothetical protein
MAAYRVTLQNVGYTTGLSTNSPADGWLCSCTFTAAAAVRFGDQRCRSVTEIAGSRRSCNFPLLLCNTSSALAVAYVGPIDSLAPQLTWTT